MVYDLFYTSPSDDTPSGPHDRSRVSKRADAMCLLNSLTPEGTSTNRRSPTVDGRRSTVDGTLLATACYVPCADDRAPGLLILPSEVLE